LKLVESNMLICWEKVPSSLFLVFVLLWGLTVVLFGFLIRLSCVLHVCWNPRPSRRNDGSIQQVFVCEPMPQSVDSRKRIAWCRSIQNLVAPSRRSSPIMICCGRFGLKGSWINRMESVLCSWLRNRSGVWRLRSLEE